MQGALQHPHLASCQGGGGGGGEGGDHTLYLYIILSVEKNSNSNIIMVHCVSVYLQRRVESQFSFPHGHTNFLLVLVSLQEALTADTIIVMTK